MNAMIRSAVRRLFDTCIPVTVCAGCWLVFPPIPTRADAVEVELDVVSDSSWVCSATETAGWQNVSFDDSSWTNAVELPGYPYPPDDFIPGTVAVHIWEEGAMSTSPAFFRKSFLLDVPPATSHAVVRVDDVFDFYVNGVLVGSQGVPHPAQTYDITTQLQAGDNVFALRCANTIEGWRALLFDADVMYLEEGGVPDSECEVFAAARLFDTGLNPYAVEIADLNNDGNPDLATANQRGSDNVSVLLGDGRGGFERYLSVTAGSNPRSVKAADLNADGFIDLVTANYSGNSISVLMGRGDGTFGNAVDHATGVNCASVVVKDFNDDGVMDLAASNLGAGNVSVLLGYGDGSFGEAVSYPAGSGPFSVASGDFNGDETPDLVTANYYAGRVSVLLGNGDGTFQDAISIDVGAYPDSVAVGDFNGDDRMDLVTTGYRAGENVSLLLGNGDGSFQARLTLAVPPYPYAVAVADFDGDRRADLITANLGSSTVENVPGFVSVLKGNGDGTFERAVSHATGSRPPYGVAVGDLNKDGRPDATTANYYGNNVSLLLGSGDGSLQAVRNFPAGAYNRFVAVGDFNEDGWSDLVTVKLGTGRLLVLPGSGDGSFEDAVEVASVGSPYSVAVDDFNGDGHADLVAAIPGDNSVAVVPGNGDGTFQSPLKSATGAYPVFVATGDCNGDHLPDVVAANHDADGVSVLLGYGDGRFRPPMNFSSGDSPIAVVLEDFDGNGTLDMAIANYGSNTVTIRTGSGSGSFGYFGAYPVGVGPNGLVSGDINGDGDPDLAVANLTGNSISVLRGAGGLSFHPALHVDMPGVYRPSSLVLGDFDRDGMLDMVTANWNNSVSLLLGAGDGTLDVSKTIGVGRNPISVAAGDFNNDGRSDVVTANYSGGDVSVLLGKRCNEAPVVDAGSGQAVSLGSMVYLNGGATTDDFTPLPMISWTWSVESAPVGSAALLSDPDTPYPKFRPDLAGSYRFKLVATDEDGLSGQGWTTLDVEPLVSAGSFEGGLAGWTGSGTVTVQSGLPYTSTDGSNLVSFNDRNLTPDGVLSQVVETVSGMVYRLQFDVGVLSYVNKQQRLGLEVSNGTVLLSDTITLAGTTGGKVTWQSKDYLFTADGNSASIVFRDLSPWTNGIDLLLDHIRVTSTALPMQVVSEPGPGVGIQVSPVDVPGDGDGTTGFQRIYNPGSVVELLAPETFGTSMFFNWLKDGAHLDTDRWVEVTMDDAHLMTAVYWGGEPIITEQPVEANALDGGTAEFRVVASGGVPLDFQWRFEGSDIAGADSPVLLIDPVTPADVGSYDVVISNTYGTVSSSVVGLGIGSSFAGLENGGFEADFQGWTVSGNLAVKSDMPYVATEGVKLTAFNAGNSPPNGVLFQVFDTTPGQPYVLSFDMGVLAYNTRAQSMEVEVTGSPSLVSDTFTMNGAGGGKTIWRNQTMSFTSDSARTTVLFRDVSTWTNAIDLMLDHVVVTPVIMRTLTVEGTPVGQVYVEYTPPDAFGDAAFWTDFSRNYPEGTQITLSAGDPYITSTYPSKGLVYNFQRWLMDDVEISTDPEVTFVLDGDRTLTAVYEEAPPVILTQPENVVTTVGGSAWFQVECVPYGYGAFQACQWRFNGIPIVGETTNTLLIDPVGVEHVGTYDVVVFNSSGASLASEPVTLTLATGSLTNGSFESEFDGWNTSGNVRVQNGSPAPDGVRIAAFNSGNTTPGGSVSQMFLTEPGRLYSMRFELGLLSYVVGWQEMEVTVEGDWPAASRTFRMNRASYREPTTRWETKTVNFVANGPETTITFRDASLSTNGIDLLLDHIRLVPPDPFLVTTSVDEDDGALGQGEGDSLREALAEATGSAAANIRFAPALDGQTIVLDGKCLMVDSDVAIDANNLPSGLAISGDGTFRIFEIPEGRTVSIAGLTMSGGGFELPSESGAGILNHGNLTLSRVTVTGCNGVGDVIALGGGICNLGSLTIVDSTITGNWLINGVGGGIYNQGILIVERSTISDNSADDGGGGGICNEGERLDLINSTIANNSVYAGSGGGILGEVSLIRNTTVSGNLAAYLGVGGVDGSVDVMENSIVAGNLADESLHVADPIRVPSDTGAPLETRGVNFIGGNPMLGPLGDHGGPTHTMPPLSGSPVIDAAIFLPSTPRVDQRGVTRPQGGAPDIGSVEIEVP